MKLRIISIARAWISKMNRRLFVRHVLCFLLVLMLPTVAFWVTYQQVFRKAYESKLLEQYSDKHELTRRNIDNMVKSIQHVRNDYALQSAMHPHTVANNTLSFRTIGKLLSNTMASNIAFHEVAFYTFATPDIVYTARGTYNLAYYKTYNTGNDLWISLREVARGTMEGQWFSRTEILWEYPAPSLEYITPINSERTAFAIFSFDQSFLSNLGDFDSEQSFLISSDGRTLYPTSSSWPDWLPYEWQSSVTNSSIQQQQTTHGYVIGSKIANTSLLFAQLIPHELVGGGIETLHRSFSIIVGLISVVGVFLINLLTIVNYRPIQRLNKVVSLKLGAVSPHQSEIDAALHALDMLDTKIEDMQKGFRKEKALLRLLHEQQASDSQFTQILDDIALPEKPQTMYILSLYITNEDAATTWGQIDRVMNPILSAQVRAVGLEYVEERCFVYVLFGEALHEEDIRLMIESLYARMRDLMEDCFALCLSSPCEEYSQLSERFHETMVAIQTRDEQDAPIFSTPRRQRLQNMLVPDMEIESFCNAIAFANEEKLELMAVVLTGYIDSINRMNPYTAMSLGYDIIERGMHAIDELLKPTKDIAFIRVIESKKRKASSIEDMIEVVWEIVVYARKKMTETRTQIDYSKTMDDVYHFINQNYKSNMLYVGAIADRFSLSISNLSHQFKTHKGTTLHAHISQARMRYAKELLLNNSMTIQQISDAMEFSQPSSFIRKFKSIVGCTPKEYRDHVQSAVQTDVNELE